MHLLENVIQEYAWGSHSALAELLGHHSPSEKPQAELWMGAHPAAPSKLSGRSLAEIISQAPLESVGAKNSGAKLPFLLKVLAARTPLSLQAHPSLSQARAGFAREEAQGIPLNAPHRNYKDDNHKPELICALSPFDALCGFRARRETQTLLESLQVPALTLTLKALNDDGVRGAFEQLMTLAKSQQAELCASALKQIQFKAPGHPHESALRLALRLGELYPADIGALSSLLLNFVRLSPGQALYLPAGNLHAYVEGVGVEIMASSDNVLRGGLTPKHVDVPELLTVLDFKEGPVEVLTAQASPQTEGEHVYLTPSPEFRLARLEVTQAGVAPLRRGPEILLCVEGSVSASQAGAPEFSLKKGQASFVYSAEGPYRLQGQGTVFRATTGG